MVEIIGQLGKDCDRWHDWANRQPVSELLHSRYAKGRLEAYYGLGVTLSQQPEIYQAIQDGQVDALGHAYCPHWHSALLCKYLPGVGINPHRDHACFMPWAVVVNLGEANFFEYPGRERVVTPLVDGAIVRINTKILHGVEPVGRMRYSLTFRHLKPAYLETASQPELFSR
ncbi:MAG TPA: hypothetical protein V6D06_20700 [Trichocoleus sp.]